MVVDIIIMKPEAVKLEMKVKIGVNVKQRMNVKVKREVRKKNWRQIIQIFHSSQFTNQ